MRVTSEKNSIFISDYELKRGKITTNVITREDLDNYQKELEERGYLVSEIPKGNPVPFVWIHDGGLIEKINEDIPEELVGLVIQKRHRSKEKAATQQSSKPNVTEQPLVLESI